MMMPLTMASVGEMQTIKKVGGKQEVKLFLESLGFTTGAIVTIVSKNQGNLITKIKDSRVAISQEMANKITI
ncbi:ferrous iron transport protein A [Thomasclavelia cocleata]|nr:ferrous iron transport protein A [Thomasclavelia cocleata]PJN81435.1 ferrous iron transport protein A [Thomasclavelia cocleata]